MFHKMIGHANEKYTKLTAEKLEVDLQNSSNLKCIYLAIANKQ